MERFDVDQLDDDWPFEIDSQVSHLFKHPGLSVADIGEVWSSEPLFYPAVPPAHWLMVAEVAGRIDHPTRAVEERRSAQVPPDRLLRGCRPSRPPVLGGSMTEMTPEQENAFYADPTNQEPQGPPVRRKAKLGHPIPVRLPDDVLLEVRERAAADDRSVSNWIRRAVEHELARDRR